MGRLLNEDDVYALFAPNGTARLHVADIDALPRVEAKEVVHGRWIKDDYTHRYRCSACEAYQPYDTVGDYIDYWDCDYCPNCGTKMDLEDKE